MTKTALITGITGQDGAYLAEFLLNKGYIVHGIKRRSSSFNTERIDHLYRDPHERNVNFFMHYGDLTDSTNLIRIVQEVQPDEIYNLAAQSHVQVSFDTPEYTANSDAVGTLRLLEAIRILGLEKKTIYRLMMSDFVEPVNIGNPDEMTVLEFARKVIEIIGSDSRVVFEKLPVDDPKVRRRDISRAKEVLGWEPEVGLGDGLERTVEYFENLDARMS